MKILNCLRLLILIPLLYSTPILIFPGSASGQQLSVEGETGLIWFSRNDVRIPNDGGTEFDMINLIGSEVAPFIRFRVNLTFNERHTVRALIAPLSKIGTGSFDEPVIFEETTFEANTPIDGTYRFNTYRITYRYTFYNQNNWVLGAGLAGLIRDAEVALAQPDRSDSSTDFGFVPLVHLYVQRDLGAGFSLILDGETLAGPQGRATDAALTFNYKLSDNWSLNAGYRVLEGGADVDQVYNFAWINYALTGLKVDF
jgi:hypothetical protein